MIKHQRKLKNSKKTGIAVFTAVICFLCLVLVGLFVFNVNYNEIYGTPRVRSAVLDMTGRSTVEPERTVAFNLAGEWEFFYNRWVITDDETRAEPDGLISVPGHWTGKSFGEGKPLPAQGYASYRLTVKNLAAGNTLWIYRVSFGGAYRIFINGELATVCGTVSKDPSETQAGSPQRSAHIVSDGEDITIVIELSACSNGGLNAAPWLSSENGFHIGKWSAIADMRFAMLGAIVAVFVFILFTVIGFYRYEKNIDMAVLAGILAVHFLFSKDIANALDIGYDVASVIGLITGYMMIFAYAVVLYRLGIGTDKRVAIALGTTEAVCLVAYILLRSTDLAFVPLGAAVLISAIMLYPLCVTKKIGALMKTSLILLYLLAAGTLLLEAADGTGAIVFGTESIFSCILAVMMFLSAFIISLRAIEMTRLAIRTNNLERELFRLKQDTLQAQIKPHFVFNSLTAIQALYRQNTDDGEAQLLRFADYLRTNIDAKGDALIPFSEELKHVMNYFELENLRRGGALTLLLDIKEDDFDVPLLSLQPLVENAVRYAKTEELDDGYIQLSTDRVGDGIAVRVTDNGVGFNVSETNKRVGLNNVCERFEGLLGARVELNSSGEGTEISIFIPDTHSYDKIGDNNEDSDS